MCLLFAVTSDKILIPSVATHDVINAPLVRTPYNDGCDFLMVPVIRIFSSSDGLNGFHVSF